MQKLTGSSACITDHSNPHLQGHGDNSLPWVIDKDWILCRRTRRQPIISLLLALLMREDRSQTSSHEEVLSFSRMRDDVDTLKKSMKVFANPSVTLPTARMLKSGWFAPSSISAFDATLAFENVRYALYLCGDDLRRFITS